MPDTGLPWEIPYAAPADLVRDWPALSEDVADAVAAGLSAAAGLVAVKHALFTGTQTNSTAAGANFAVTDLSITHTLADAANKLIISAYFGAAGSSDGRGNVGIAVADDGTLINIGDTSGDRTRVSAGGFIAANTLNIVMTMPSITFVYEPGDTAAHTFTVRAINIDSTTNTIFINRTDQNLDDEFEISATAGLVIQEVRV
jgi:hypothetical protein